MTGVIFDFNGTLYRDSDKHEAAWQVFATQHLKRNLLREEFDRYFHGKSNHEVITYIFNASFTEQEANDLAEGKEKIYRELCIQDKAGFHLTEGAPEFLDLLVSREIPIMIATSSEKRNLDFYFESFGLSRWFSIDKVIFSDGNLKSKPDPDSYRKASVALNREPKDCFVFEDSLSGIESAKRAGVGKIIGVSTGENHKQLESLGVLDMVIDDFYDERLLRLIR
jgi:beta-phosphoglucomutase-like phosphatase (HAD superfamily)